MVDLSVKTFKYWHRLGISVDNCIPGLFNLQLHIVVKTYYVERNYDEFTISLNIYFFYSYTV